MNKKSPGHAVTKHLVVRDRMQLAPGDLIWVPENLQWQRIIHLEVDKLCGLCALFAASTEPVVLSHRRYQVVVTGVVQEEA